MQRAHLCFVLVVVGGVALASAAETVRPNPDDGELAVNDFTQSQSTTLNALGYSVATAEQMEITFPEDGDPRAVLTPKSTSSFFYSFLRQPEHCFDASNFDYISLELKTETDLTVVVGFSSNPKHCDDEAQSEIRYSLARIAYKATGQKRTVADIPISAMPGDALKSNMNAIIIGGLTTPIEVYSIKLKTSSSETVDESTIVADTTSDQGSGASDVAETESDKASTLVIESFETDDKNVNVLGGTHSTDGTMPHETYTAGKGVYLTSSGASSYWYTVIPCTDSTTFKHYDMVLLDVVGAKGGDFTIRLNTLVQCEAVFKEFVFKASDLLKVKLDGTLQHVAIPFDMMPGFDKKIHTIQSVVIGDFRNEQENHASATPMNLNVRSVSLSGTTGNGYEEDDKKQERIAAKEKENPAQYERSEERVDSHSAASEIHLSFIAICSLVAIWLLL